MTNTGIIFISRLVLITTLLVHCKQKPEPAASATPEDYIKPIPGKSDSVAAASVKKGAVLIAYSDCATCHKEDKRSVGPSFRDISQRYPLQEAYIKYLAQKVISGGSRSWGYPVMIPHPGLSLEDAKLMVTYILSKRDPALILPGRQDR